MVVASEANTQFSVFQERISRQAFEQLAHVRGEGDEWDFKASLGNLADTASRANLAKDALAMCNLRDGGTLIVGVTDDFERIGLPANEHIDTTEIRRALEKYIDGDFLVLAAEHTLVEPGEAAQKRFGIVYLRRRFAQPVLAAVDGHVPNQKQPLFRSGDILVRRGAASIRANSGDVRQLFMTSIVHEERVRAVNELWKCLVEERELLGGVEFLYDLLPEPEYQEVMDKPDMRGLLGTLTEGQHAQKVDQSQKRVRLVRPHIPDELYQQYRACSAFIARLEMKVIREREAGVFLPWTMRENGEEDQPLYQMGLQLIAKDELDALWTGRTSNIGTWRPLRPVTDAAESNLLAMVRQVLSGMA